MWSASADSFYFPPLAEILRSFQETWLFARFPTDVLPSLGRMFLGYAIAVVIAVVSGVALGLSVVARQAASPLVEFFRAIPPTALLPFAILVFGVGFEMKVFIIAFVCVWPVLLNTIDGVRAIDPVLRETVRVYRLSNVDQLRRIVLPAIAPQVFAGMRTSLSLAVILMVVSEMVASTNGIGYFVLQAQRSFDIAEMWSGILLLGIFGYLLNAVFIWIERRSLTWYRAIRSSST
ncbi:ABC transporter permease [Microbacterium album]|uniref:ABC transporter permease n=1 Tax=Microbacterium album TaxID=2053191 RepID=UPI001E2DE3D9|nr:ABC transporter permease [Microbacterium album]